MKLGVVAAQPARLLRNSSDPNSKSVDPGFHIGTIDFGAFLTSFVARNCRHG